MLKPDKSVHTQGAAVLARAVKEQERRKGERDGFSSAPGDCLAYKHYRDVRAHTRLKPLAVGSSVLYFPVITC